MTPRIPSGSAGLDGILGGGLAADSITLVCGPPGSGKTILAEQYVFENATIERPAVYMSTVSEPFEKIIRYGQTLDFFDAGRVGQDVFYEDLGTPLVANGLAAVAASIDAILKDRRPAILVIDSFKALAAFANSEADYRRFLHEVAGRLSATAVSAIWIGEYDRDDSIQRPEFAVADCVLYLTTRPSLEREMRVLSVLKQRGGTYSGGQHAYRITGNGLRLFPRLADPQDLSAQAPTVQRASTGIPALDKMLNDGYWPGSSTLITGPSGAGKTLMGLHFVFAGAQSGENGVFATLQESPVQLARIVSGFGWSLDTPGVEVMSRSPVDMYLDEWVHDLLDTVDRANASRVVIDSIGDLIHASTDELRFREYMHSLLQRFSRDGVACLMTLELPELFRTTRIGEQGMSHLSDNVVLLQHVLEGGEIKRGLAVLKTRASQHDARIREFHITPEGILIGDPLTKQPFMS